MATSTTHGFPASADFPHPPEDAPGWSESFLVQAYSPEAGVGVFAHSNRCHFDKDLWSEVFAVYLPEDRFLAAKGFGYSHGPQQVGGSISYGVERPFELTGLSYRGAAQRLSGEQLRSGPTPSGIHTGLEVDLACTGLGPPFGVGDTSKGEFGHTHYEQHFTFSGHIAFDGQRLELEGTGFRDHTWGPRDLSVMANHIWCHGEFRSGRWFSSMFIRGRGGDQALLDFHAIGDADGYEACELLSTPALLDDEGRAFETYRLELRTRSGEELSIDAEVVSPFPFSFMGPVEMTLGANRGPEASHTVFEAQTRYRLAGEVGYGLSERSVVHDEEIR